jgi:hypothetical protein
MHYRHIVGKIGIDSTGSWIAVVDGESGKVLVQSMDYQNGVEYPDGATVEIWTNGLGTLSAYGRTVTMPESVEENPYLIESELLGPLTKLDPGESASLTYDWFAGTIGVNRDGFDRIIACSNVGCIVRPFTVSHGAEMSGHFGCFCEGYAALELYDESGKLLEPARSVGPISMGRPFYLGERLQAPDGVFRVTLAVYKTQEQMGQSVVNVRLGELGTVVLRS